MSALQEIILVRVDGGFKNDLREMMDDWGCACGNSQRHGVLLATAGDNVSAEFGIVHVMVNGIYFLLVHRAWLRCIFQMASAER